jgi:hypothetical protein
MTSTNRNPAVYHENYETPRWVVHRLLEEVWLPPGHWIEPCAANGRIIQAVCEDRPGCISFTAVELRKECLPNLLLAGPQLLEAGRKKNDPRLIHCPRDFIKGFSPSEHRPLIEGTGSYFDVAITNPPFSKSFEILSKCLVIAEYVAMLQRTDWLSGGSNNGKNEFLRSYPPNVHPLPDRIKFMVNGQFPRYPMDFEKVELRGKTMPGDSSDYSWFVWPPKNERRRDFGLVRNLGITSLEERTQNELSG